MKVLLFFLFIFYFPYGSRAQNSDDERIAIQFFQLREYDKAESLLKKQYDLQPSKFYDYLYRTYIHLKKYDEAIALTKTALKGNQSKNIDFRFKLGYAYFKKNDSTNAKKEWLNTNELINENEFQVTSLIHQYNELKQWYFSEDAILKYQNKVKNKDALSTNLLDLYLFQKKFNEAIDLTIHIIDKSEQNYMAVLGSFQYLNGNADAMRIMEKKVFSKLSADPNSDKWNEIAMWLSISIKDYEQALSLAKSFEKRKNGNGNQVLQIAEVALNEAEYDVAIDGFEYLTHIQNSSFSKLGFEKKIDALYKKIQQSKIKDSNSIHSLHQSFLQYFGKYSFDYTTAETQLLFAEFNVKYLQRLDNALSILEKMLQLPQLTKYHTSRGKIDLADIKLAMNDIWEASLLYGQVDKEEKDSPLGEEARFKNAKVFYFNGDYELAEELLSILKSSTTELIANDALYLAVFIQENQTEPALQLAMKDISGAELLFYQNKAEEAFRLLNSAKKVFPNSSLMDDILLLEANYALKKMDFVVASEKFKEIYEKYPTSIISDKALYEWSKIEEEQNKNSSTAIDGYLKLLTKFKDSVYTDDARKRLRKLRGEKLDEEL